MQTDVHVCLYLAEYFLKWEMFQTKGVEKIKNHFIFSNFMENPTPGQATVNGKAVPLQA